MSDLVRSNRAGGAVFAHGGAAVPRERGAGRGPARNQEMLTERPASLPVNSTLALRTT